MILLAALLVLGAVGLLVAGLAQGSAPLQWASFGASALAAVLLAVTELRGRRRTRAEAASPDQAAPRTPAPPAEESPAEESPDVEVVRRAAPPPVPPSSPSLPRVSGPASGATRASGLGDLARTTDDAGPPAHQPPPAGRSTGAHSATDLPRVTGGDAAGVPTSAWSVDGTAALGADGEPTTEEVEVTDLLLVLDLTDEVLVVDEHPRYHLAGCPHLTDVATIPLPMVEARTDGFTPCGTCTPDRVLAGRERDRRSA